jgi:hypothetical protein
MQSVYRMGIRVAWTLAFALDIAAISDKCREQAVTLKCRAQGPMMSVIEMLRQLTFMA